MGGKTSNEGKREKIKLFAAEHGETVNSMINRLIAREMGEIHENCAAGKFKLFCMDIVRAGNGRSGNTTGSRPQSTACPACYGAPSSMWPTTAAGVWMLQAWEIPHTMPL